jgi:hypothetical protein
MSWADSDSHTARQTSQLQPIPRRKTCQCVSVWALATAIAVSRASGVPDDAGLHGQNVGDEQRADQVGHRDQGPVHRDARGADPFRECRHRQQRHVAGQQVGTGEDDEDEAEAEHRPEHEGRQGPPQLGVEPRRHRDGEQGAERDVGAGEEPADQYLAGW